MDICFGYAVSHSNYSDTSQMKRLLILLVMATAAQAATWVTYAHDPMGTRYDFEPTLITNHDNSGRVLVVWNRIITAGGYETRNRHELHCASRSTRLMYQVKNNTREVVYELDDAQARWRYAVPDTVEMTLIDTICARYK